MNERTKNVVITVVCILMMCFFVLAAILYAEGFYDISFIRRTVIETDPPETTEPPDTSPYPVHREPTVEELLASFPVLSSLDGAYRQTDAVYVNGKSILARVELGGIGTSLVSGTKPSHTLIVSEEKSGKKIYTYEAAETERYTVEVYLGYFIVSDGGRLRYFNGKGQEVLENYSGEAPIPAYERDQNGRALFCIGDGYYYIDEAEKRFAESDFTPEDARGIYYNYPSVPGTMAAPSVFRDNSGWGYLNAAGSPVLKGYVRTYPFSEGLGFADKGESSVYINESGAVAIKDICPVGRAYDMISVGSVYFDSGHVIVRRVAYDRLGNCVEDRELLVDKNGKEFQLPIGCTLAAYSNGRLLVERDGKYGFFAVKGEWTVDTLYPYAMPFSEGLAVIGRADGKKAVIDREGNLVMDFCYSYISICTGGVICAYDEEAGFSLFVKLEKEPA